MKVLRRIGKIAAIVLAVAIVAFIVWTIISCWAAIMLFLLNLLTAISLLILFGIPAISYIYWLSFRSANYRYEGKSAHMLIVILLLIYALTSVRAHFIERSRMDPLRKEFIFATQTGGEIIGGDPLFGKGSLDFNGRLTALVEKRTNRCRKDGFVFIGSWDVSQASLQSDQEASTFGIYIWAPWVAL